jgi:hypothetical protein
MNANKNRENPYGGLRYRTDRLAQGIGPLRAADAWGLKHPVANALSFLLIGAFLVWALSTTVFDSWIEGSLTAAVATVLLVFSTRANHRRRLRNGTSAEYGPPKR